MNLNENLQNGIPLFDGSNYNNWSFRLATLLDERNLLPYIEKNLSEIVAALPETATAADKTKCAENEKKCKTIIVRTVHDCQLETIKEKKSSKEMIDALKAIYERKSVSSQLFLRKQLLTLKYNESEEMSNHFMVFDKLIRSLKSSGAEMGEIETVCLLLLTMPKSFDGLVTALETMEPDRLTPEFVKNRLLDEANKRKQGGSLMKSGGSSAMNAGVICYSCNKPGHYKSQCLQRKKKAFDKGKSTSHWGKSNKKSESANNAKSDEIQEELLCAVESDGANALNTDQRVCVCTNEQENQTNEKFDDAMQIKFVLDSGATEHMVNKKEYFDCLSNIDAVGISVAKKNEMIVARQKGDIIIKTFYNGDTKTKTLKNVLFVKELKCNLLSIKSLTAKGYTVNFGKDIAYVLFKGKTIFAAHAKGKLYEVILYRTEKEYANVTSNFSQNLWHYRLGHLNIVDIKKLVDRKMVDGLDKVKLANEADFCEPCMFGKQTRLPFTKKKEIRSNRILELIHSDVCGPMSQSAWDGSNYFVTFMDDYSRASMVFCIKRKSEVFDKFREYVAMSEAHHCVKIAKLRVDNGGEYISIEFRDFCKERGICIQYTTPYNPEMNSVSERLNRTLVEKARTMLLASDLKRIFWNEAIMAANYIKNRCPTSAVGEQFRKNTPAEIWNRKKPNLFNLRVFGSVCYNHIPIEKRNKLDAKSSKCIMLGYASSNSYRLWDVNENKFVIGRNVTFDEYSIVNNDKYVNAVDSEADDFDSKNIDDKQTLSNASLDHGINMEDTGNSNQNIHGAKKDCIGNGEENVNDTKEDCIGNIKQISHGGAWDITGDNKQQVLRRGTRERKKPIYYGYDNDDLHSSNFALSAEQFVQDDPLTVNGAKQRTDWLSWKKAMDSEYASLIGNNTWNWCELPFNRKTVACKWVFKIKYKANGEIDKYKARVVAKGYSQRIGFDYNDTYAPVAKLTTLRIILSIANHFDMEIHQMDVKCAFLNGDLLEEIYMEAPEGYENNGMVCKLIKAIYGLKQASRMWNEKFNSFMIRLGFIRCVSDRCLYIKSDHGIKCYILLYVDDLLIVCSDVNMIKTIKQLISKEFEMTDVGEVDTFLGMHIQRNKSSGTIAMSQAQYLKRVLEKFGMSDCRGITTPLETNLDLRKVESGLDPDIPYRELIGCLIYVTLTTRPDLCASTNYFSRFQACYTEEHFNYAKRILRYIKETIDLKFVYKKHEGADILHGYVDADWAGDKTDRKSTSGYVFKVFGNTIAWASRKQSTVSLSSTEAEYIALAEGVCEAKWLRSLLRELGFECEHATIIYEDNQSCIYIANEPRDHKRLKHVDVKFNFIRDSIAEKEIELRYKQSNEQVADIMTKALTKTLFIKHRHNLDLE